MYNISDANGIGQLIFMEDFKMKKIVLSLLLVMSMLLALAACDMGGKKDNPEKNINYLVESINEGATLGEIQENTQPVDVEEVLAKLKEAACELSFSGTVDGESGSAYVGFKDMVLYASSNEGDENYIFIEDDWTLVNVVGFDGEYYGEVDASLKEMMAYLTATESAPEVTPEDDAATAMISTILAAIAEADLPDITAEDIEHKDGKYVLSENYIKTVLEKYVDVVFDELGALGMPSDEILDAKAVIKGYLDYIKLEIYYYIDREEVKGVGVAVSLDETFAAEKIGYSEIALSVEICTDKVAFDLKIANADDVLADVSAIAELKLGKEDKLESLKLDVDAKINVPGEKWDDEKEEFVTTVTPLVITADLDLDLVDMSKGKGEFMTCTVTYTDGDVDFTANASATSSEKGDKIAATFNFVAHEDGETQKVDLSFDLNLKGAPNMPAVPQGAVDAKDEAIASYGNEDIWY